MTKDEIIDLLKETEQQLYVKYIESRKVLGSEDELTLIYGVKWNVVYNLIGKIVNDEAI
jgi:hypothetical protein